MIIEKENRPYEMNRIEFEDENEKLEECDKNNYVMGCYLNEIFDYVRNNEVNLFLFHNNSS